jgi:hypothetical protein
MDSLSKVMGRKISLSANLITFDMASWQPRKKPREMEIFGRFSGGNMKPPSPTRWPLATSSATKSRLLKDLIFLRPS